MKKVVNNKFIFIVYLIMLFPLNVLANCEYYTYGIHTIADYDNSQVTKIKYNKPYMFYSSSFNKNLKKLRYNQDVCKLKENEIKLTEKESSYSRLKSCLDIKSDEYFATYIDSQEVIELFHPVSTRPFTESEELVKSIMKEIKNTKIVLANDYTIPKNSKLVYIEGQHQTIEEDLIFSSVKIELSDVKLNVKAPFGRQEITGEAKGVHFYVVLLTKNGKTWYIADSASNHCDRGISSQLLLNKDKLGKLGHHIGLFKAYRLSLDKSKYLISFGVDGSLHYLEFGKKLSVVKQPPERITNWDFKVQSR